MHITAAMTEGGSPALGSASSKRSYSDRSLRPAVHPSRRQSDSTLTRSGSSKDLDIDGRAKLREWAANALVAPPPIIAPCDTDEASHDLAGPSQPRRSRTRSRSPPGSARLDADGLHSRRKSLFSPSTAEPVVTAPERLAASPDVLSDSENPAASRRKARANIPSLIMTAERSQSPTSLSRTASRASTSTPPTPDTHKGLAQRRMESGQLDEKVFAIGSLGLETAPRLNIKSPSASSGGRTARPHLQTPTQRSLKADRLTILADDDATPRPQSIDSPLSTTSTCETDDERHVDTPLEDASFQLSGNRSYTSSNLSFATSAGNGTPPLDTLNDEPADRIGSARGLQELYENALTDGPIATVMNGNRRGSASAYEQPRPVPSLSTSTSSTSTILADAPAVPLVPTLSRSTLMQLGSIEGITPPSLTGHTASAFGSGSTAESSSVVSAGLEMGLGVGMATAALAATLPSGFSGLGNFAEPRYSRLPPMALDMRSLPSFDPKVTGSQLQSSSSGSAAGRPLSMIGMDNSVGEEKHRSNIETDLSRRKTTGWDAAKSRRDLSKRHRAETHDEVLSHTAARNSMSQAHRQDVSGVVSLIPQRESYYDVSGPSAPGSSSFSSFDSRSTQPRASRSGSTQLDTPSLSGRAMLSPDVNPNIEARGGMFGGQRDSMEPEDERVRQARENLLRDEANGGQASGGNNGGLMGSNVGGHFGPGVRAKVIEILDPLIAAVPLSASGEETINLVEYGCLNSRSIPLMQLIISKFAQRSLNRHQALSSVSEEGAFNDGSDDDDDDAPMRNVFSRHIEGQSSRFNFSVIHEDSPQADFRLISQSLDSRSDSYLDPTWQSVHQPLLQNAIFPSFVGRPFASRIAPPRTLHFGMSLMDLHWTHTPFNAAVPLATSAHAELVTFLKARAHEFRQGGVLVLAFLARSDDGPAVTSSGKRSGDIWSTLTNTLAPCIQRLVSCGMLKSDVARFLLDLPLHPRTPRQTRNALMSLRHLWNIEWSCGLGEEDATKPSAHRASAGGIEMGRRGSLSPSLTSEPQPLRIAHPAWKAFTAGTLSKVAMAEHMIMLFKNLYEAHFRKVLREKGKLSKGAVEFVLDSLWDVVSSRVDDHPSNPMKEVEIEVTVCALKRL